MIFQEPMTSLNPLHTIEKQVNEVLFVHKGLGRRAARARTLELLGLVGLPEAARRLDAYPHQLSGGQRQRVMIAMALANEPDLLVADEPTTALDVTIEAQILKLLRDLQARFGMALLLITHDLGDRPQDGRSRAGHDPGRGGRDRAGGRGLRAAAARVHAAPPGRRAGAAAARAADRGAGRHGGRGGEGVVPREGGGAAAHGRPRQGGGRGERHGPGGPDGRRRGRERLGQDHAGAGPSPPPPERWADPLPRPRPAAPGHTRAAPASQGNADRLPGSLRIPVAPAVGRPDRRRGARRPSRRPERRGRGDGDRRGARGSRPRAGGAGPLPARAVGRSAAARRARPRARAQAPADHSRRAHVRARPVDPGADDRSPAGAPGAPPAGVPLHQPRPPGDPRAERRGHRHAGGIVVERGSTAAIFERPAHPYTRALIAAALDLEVVEDGAVAS